MKIATYNVNGIGARLPALIRWLAESKPDVACLQELKAPQEKFPEAAIRDAGYGVIWHGQKSWNGVAILARGADPVESRRALPGDPEDLHSRYIEALINGVRVGCLYLPNGNPAPGPKFDYKLRWLERLTKHAQELLATAEPVVLAGDYNVIPTEIDVYKPEHWVKDALFLPEVRSAFANLVAMGWTDALRKLHPDERIYTFWDYFRNNYARDAGLRIDHLLLSPSVAPHGWSAQASIAKSAAGKKQATTHPHGWKSRTKHSLASWRSRAFFENSRVGLLRRGGLILRLLPFLRRRHFRDHFTLESERVFQRQFDAAINQRLGGLERIGSTLDIDARDLFASLISSAAGATRLTRPMRNASSGVYGRPLKIISFAIPAPTSRGRRCVPPPAGSAPKRISGRPMVAVSAITRMSHASAISHPPPIAAPLIAAITGTEIPRAR